MEQKYTWAVDASLGAENVYGIVLRLESNPEIFQFSNPFHIVKADGGDDDDSTKTVSVSHGTKTITLSSQKPTSTYTPTPTTTPIFTPTTAYTKPTSVATKTSTVEEEPQESETSTETGPAVFPTDEPDAGARFGASSVALVGAFVVAAFAL